MKAILKMAAAGLLLAIVGYAVIQLAPPCTAGCNVVLIMVDTLAAGHIATYGYNRDTLPQTTAFFEKHGIIFDDASSNASWTLPSFTGMYFSDIASHVTYKDLESDTRPSLQSELRSHGITINAVRPPGENFIFDGITRLFKRNELFTNTNGLAFEGGTERLKELVGKIEPFFLQIHTFEVHDPYAPQEPYSGYFGTSTEYAVVTMQQLRAENALPKGPDPETADTFRLRYDQGIAGADAHIAAFLNSVPSSVLNDTVIILAADHGEAFNEHGKVWHANSVHQEEIHIPLMMAIPGVSPRRVSQPVSLLDMSPTILSLMKIPVPREFLGKSMIPYIEGLREERVIPSITGYPFFLQSPTAPVPRTLRDAGAVGSRNPVIIPNMFGVRIGSLKLIETAEEIPKIALYNLADDPGETHSLAAAADAIPKNLLDALEALRETTR